MLIYNKHAAIAARKFISKESVLRILTERKHPEIKLLRKVRIWTFGLLVHQINSF